MTRCLVISRIGPHSLHRKWCAPREGRGFEVLLSAYDQAVEPFTGDGIRFEHRPGPKVAGYGELFRAHAAWLGQFDYVALMDDDLDIDGDALTRLFDLAAQYRLKICQPALTHDSYFSYAGLLRHRGFRLRYVGFIEMMCPVFRSDALTAVTPLFDMGFESGIDLVWCDLVAGQGREFAVIDAVTVKHTKRVAAAKHLNGFVAGKTYEDDIAAILRRFQMPWRPLVPYAAVRANGEYADGRHIFLMAALRLAGCVRLRRPMRHRARAVLVYWKHLLFARTPKPALGGRS